MSQIIEKLQQDVASTGAIVDNLESLRTRRHRRRKIAWVGFILLGMLVGTVWSLGFANSTTAAGSTSAATAIVGGTGSTSTNSWSSKITLPENIAFGFTGTWGTFASDYTVYKVDLTDAGVTPAGTYFMTVALNQAPVGFTAVQLKWAILEENVSNNGTTTTTTCDGTTNFSSATGTQVMAIQDSDAQAVFTALDSGKIYCIGVADIAQANDTSGHFIRRPTASSLPGTFPSFMGILNRSA